MCYVCMIRIWAFEKLQSSSFHKGMQSIIFKALTYMAETLNTKH